tara:strand:+ start:38 stop:352 length:315 start_codon:yes stop_codon:yes gene_type:complete
MYLAIECEVCGKTRADCECTLEETLLKAGRVDLHTYLNKTRRAEVFLYDKYIFGCDYYETVDEVETLITSEKYEGHNEQFAEDAAENYLLGIKNFENNNQSKKA